MRRPTASSENFLDSIRNEAADGGPEAKRDERNSGHTTSTPSTTLVERVRYLGNRLDNVAYDLDSLPVNEVLSGYKPQTIQRHVFNTARMRFPLWPVRVIADPHSFSDSLDSAIAIRFDTMPFCGRQRTVTSLTADFDFDTSSVPVRRLAEHAFFRPIQETCRGGWCGL